MKQASIRTSILGIPIINTILLKFYKFYIESLIKYGGVNDTNDISKVPNAGSIFNDGDQEYQLMHNGIKIIRGGLSAF